MVLGDVEIAPLDIDISNHFSNTGLVTFQDVQANYGRDVEELFEQHEREQKLAEQYGVKTAFQPFGMKMPVEADIQGGEGGDGD